MATNLCTNSLEIGAIVLAMIHLQLLLVSNPSVQYHIPLHNLIDKLSHMLLPQPNNHQLPLRQYPAQNNQPLLGSRSQMEYHILRLMNILPRLLF